MRLPDWHIQIAYRILLSFGPKVFTRLLLLLSSTAFRASRGRHSRALNGFHNTHTFFLIIGISASATPSLAPSRVVEPINPQHPPL
jgi:hypothetical protein